ncbi:hypothetical protein EV175_005288 [Coemansia sp. RSA 1933]|nr:hypothetical protein EV175_005288 [Coemansia sp. RSA 1933]
MSSRLADVEKAVTAKIFGRDGAKMQNKVTLSFSKDTAINNCYRVGYCISQGIVDCHVNVIQIQLTGLVKTEYKSVLLNDTVSKVWQHLGFGLGNPRFFCNDTRVYKSKTILDNMLEHRAVVEVIDGGRKRFKKNKQSPLKEHILNGLREDGPRPARFTRSALKDDDELPLLKRLLIATDMEAAKCQRIGHAHAQP